MHLQDIHFSRELSYGDLVTAGDLQEVGNPTFQLTLQGTKPEMAAKALVLDGDARAKVANLMK